MMPLFFRVNRFCDGVIHFLAISSVVIFSTPAHAQTPIPIARYVSVSPQPLPTQVNLLQPTVALHFSREIHTIGEALRYLLRRSGYALVKPNALSPAAHAILLQPLPEAHRRLGLMTLQDGLLTLAGQPFGLVVDPVHRLMALRLLPSYQSLYSSR